MTKKIPLTQGKVALVDDDDFEWINQWKWYCSHDYAARPYGKWPHQHKIWMHREINHTPDGYETDHINNNSLDNRRSNLRTCKHSENVKNRSLGRDNTSKYKGVTWHKASKKWAAQIGAHNLHFHLGLFSTAGEAAKAYDEAALKKFGKFAKINFPSNNYD